MIRLLQNMFNSQEWEEPEVGRVRGGSQKREESEVGGDRSERSQK